VLRRCRFLSQRPGFTIRIERISVNMASRRILLWLSVLGFAWIATGCGSGLPETAEVNGTVTLDGKPVDGAIVVFFDPDGAHPARGVTDGSGKFTLTTFEAGDGAVLGQHKVSVSKIDESAKAPAGAEGQDTPSVSEDISESAKNLLPVLYSSPSTSGLTVEVKKGMDPVVLELKSK